MNVHHPEMSTSRMWSGNPLAERPQLYQLPVPYLAAPFMHSFFFCVCVLLNCHFLKLIWTFHFVVQNGHGLEQLNILPHFRQGAKIANSTSTANTFKHSYMRFICCTFQPLKIMLLKLFAVAKATRKVKFRQLYLALFKF